MLIIDALSRQEVVHFIAIDLAIAILIDSGEFLPQTLLLRHHIGVKAPLLAELLLL